MSTLASTVILQARRILADVEDISFSDADLLSYLNEGQKRFAAETHCCQAMADIAITDSKFAFSGLVSAAVQSVLLVTNVQLTSVSPQIFLPKAPITDIRNKTTASVPTRFSLFGDNILFDTTGAITTTATVWFTYIPVDVASTATSLGIQDDWVHAIVKYIVFSAHLTNRDAGLANGAFNEFQSVIQQAKALSVARAT